MSLRSVVAGSIHKNDDCLEVVQLDGIRIHYCKYHCRRSVRLHVFPLKLVPRLFDSTTVTLSNSQRLTINGELRSPNI